MIFVSTPLAGGFVIEPEWSVDERGAFGRTYCVREFTARGIDSRIAQSSASRNTERGTLRGMHFQRAPFEEAKTVRVTAGAIFDVMVDLRSESPTYKRWYGVELSAQTGRALHVPAGCAHGFLTLEAGSVVEYMITVEYEPSASSGIRWDDPSIGIEWPFQPAHMSERDRSLPLA